MNPEPMDTKQKRKPEHNPKDAPSSNISTPRPEQRATSTPTRKAKRSKQARIHCESSEDIGSSSGTREGTDPLSQPVASQEVHIARPVSDEEAERFLLLLQPSSSQGQSGPSIQGPSNVQESEHSKSATWTKGPEPGRTMTCMTAASSEDGRVKCRHDGKAIPFPLRPEAFHNLPLLKQALLDMTQHYDVIRRRIEQIEGTEPHRSTVNPWDLVKSG
ncbi:hypothetical protein APSETT444_010640 [Aspergillus pseudonomiae]